MEGPLPAAWLIGRLGAAAAGLGGAVAHALRGPVAHAREAAAAVLEPKTGISFPGEFGFQSGDDTRCSLTLAGVGVRNKRLVGIKNINVYAVGMYADPDAVRGKLGEACAGRPREDVATDQAVLDSLVRGELESGLRLVIAFGGLTRQRFISGLRERLDPLLKKEGKPEVCDAFAAQFDDIQLRRGCEIAFHMSAAGQVTTAVDGARVGTIVSPELQRSILDIYVGADPVAPSAKADIGKGIAGFVSA
ncbi:unnamed protein product [Pedinophyceae sp. YPF-701]|nr:unnamed protein product [Pedinophyceae sp. YPF-701]